MRQEIRDLVEMGPLPHSDASDALVLERYQNLMPSIVVPVSDEEAVALVSLFGEDDCFGLAWSLLHLIETAPSWPIFECLGRLDNEWMDRLRDRAF